MTDPGYLAYVIAESSFVRTVKDMKHIRTEVCRKLPSGTNEQGWLEIFKKCTISREISKPCMEVFYLLSMLQDRNLEDVGLSFTNLVDPSCSTSTRCSEWTNLTKLRVYSLKK
jgi:hypothetical protein